jgi:hypothetical protein
MLPVYPFDYVVSTSDVLASVIDLVQRDERGYRRSSSTGHVIL